MQILFYLLFSQVLINNPQVSNHIDHAHLADTTKNHFRDFDFWIGEWDVFTYGTDNLGGHSVIEPIIDSLVIKESYRTAKGNYIGTSLNKYNPSNKKWEQFWVDNSGLSLLIQGGIVDDKMVLVGSRNTPKGEVLDKIQWTPLEDGTVRQEWLQSTDYGTNWNKIFDGHYKRKKN